MTRHPYRACLPDAQARPFFPVERLRRTSATRTSGTQLDVCRCPKCNGPMVARQGKTGPYFHCRCPAPRPPKNLEELDEHRGKCVCAEELKLLKHLLKGHFLILG
jgi:hypothetical protein